MKFFTMRKGRLANLTVACVAMAAGLLMALPQQVGAQEVRVDLDRNTAGVQDTLQVTPTAGAATVQGAVVVTGAPTTTVGDYAVEIALSNSGGGDSVNCANSSTAPGEIMSSFPGVLCTSTAFRRSQLFVNPPIAVGDDMVLTLFTFDTELTIVDGETITMNFTSTAAVSLLGITVNGSPRTFGQGTSNPITTVGASVTAGQGGTPTPTPTEPLPTFTPAPDCEDSGYYILDSFGGRHRVGPDVVNITGPLYFGRDVARDMENVNNDPTGAPISDLALLDTFGVVHFVENPSNAPIQMFYFPEGSDPDCGFAVDVELTDDSQGFWVLTEGGGIFRAGTALPGGQDAQLGGAAAMLCDMLPMPFGGGVPRDPNVGDDTNRGTIRAVGFVVVEGGNPADPTGFVILDSQGGHYIYDGQGAVLDDGVANSVLSADTVYPFFRGLDIARDIELHPAGTSVAGLVIYDGWGGIHPVPVGFDQVNDPPVTQVAFLRNMAPAQTTTVGLPYIVAGFDDTGDAEGATSVLDVDSIFRDIEFCAASGGDGVYVMDAYGAVFAFGNTRADPLGVAPRFTGGPYFFPNKLARDLEPQTEIEMETDMAVDTLP